MTLPTAPLAERASATRDLIAAKARQMFSEHGYAGTSVRAIAAAADIDPALVMRYFGSKDKLFVHVVGFGEHIGPNLDGPLAELGERLVAHVLAVEHAEMRRTFAALVRATEREGVRESLRDTMRTLFVIRLKNHLPGADAELRAELISAQLGGLIQSLSILGEDRLVVENRERIVELAGRSIQQLVNPPEL